MIPDSGPPVERVLSTLKVQVGGYLLAGPAATTRKVLRTRIPHGLRGEERIGREVNKAIPLPFVPTAQ